MICCFQGDLNGLNPSFSCWLSTAALETCLSASSSFEPSSDFPRLLWCGCGAADGCFFSSLTFEVVGLDYVIGETTKTEAHLRSAVTAPPNKTETDRFSRKSMRAAALPSHTCKYQKPRCSVD